MSASGKHGVPDAVKPSDATGKGEYPYPPLPRNTADGADGGERHEIMNHMGVGCYAKCGFCQARDHETDDCPFYKSTQGDAQRAGTDPDVDENVGPSKWMPGGGRWEVAEPNDSAGKDHGETYPDGKPEYTDPVRHNHTYNY